MRNSNSLISVINHIAASYVLLFIFVPPIQVGNLYRLIALVATVVWFFTNGGLGVTIISSKSARFLLLSISCAVLLILTSSFIASFSTAIIRNVQFIMMCIAGYISLYYFENDPEFFDKWMTLALMVIFFFCITTIQGLIENPYASRIANSEWLEDRFEGNENVGLYGYVYMCIMLFPLLLYKIISRIKVNKLFDIFCVLDAIVIFVMALNAGYMIGLCCLLIGTLIVLLLRKPSFARIAITITLCLVFFIAYRPIVTGFFDFAESLLGDNIIYSKKINDFRALFLEGSADGYSVEGRFKNYSKSIEEMIRFPILGSYVQGKTLGGGHSTFFDTIGKNGWVVAFLYFMIMWKFPFTIYTAKSNKGFVVKLCTIVLLIVFAVFDPYSQEISLNAMVFLPYFLFITDRHEANAGPTLLQPGL